MGVAAVLAMICVPLRSLTTVRVVLAWNSLGLADILMVIVVAQRILFFGEDTAALVELTRFPMLLVPAFIVPLILITHFVVFAQLWHNRAERRVAPD